MEFFRNLNRSVAEVVENPAISGLLAVVARLFMSAIFIMAGVGKIMGYAGTQQYMQSVGVPVGLLPPVILLEVGGGLALLVGFQTRLTAMALALFCIISAFLFHSGADQMQAIMFMKNFAMAGGLFAFTLFGGGRFSLDGEGR
jgi:putative oxidoreductase